MTHDPLCRYKEAWVLNSKGYWYCIECAFISEVRKDERRQSKAVKNTVHVCADNNCWCANSLSRSELS